EHDSDQRRGTRHAIADDALAPQVRDAADDHDREAHERGDGGADVRVEDPLHRALQRVGRREQEDERGRHEHQREGRRRRRHVPIHSSSTKRAAREVSTRNSMSKSISSQSACPYELPPPIITCTAWPPATMNGIHNGSVSSGSITSRARSCATMAANMQPSAAMPIVARRTAAASGIDSGVPKNSASAGSSTASHSTSSAAAASALPAKMAAGGADVRITCSRLACSFSAANARPNASSPANTSASHSTPGAIAGALRLSIWKPKFAITSASTTNWASAGTSSRLRHSETRSLRATASATAMDLMSVDHVQAPAGAHHVSLAQLDGAVPESRRERLVVRREDDRPLLHHAREQLRRLGVEAGVGLVEDEEQRVVDGRAGDREPLLQAARKL